MKHTALTTYNCMVHGTKYIHIVMHLSTVIHLLNFSLPKLKLSPLNTNSP